MTNLEELKKQVTKIMDENKPDIIYNSKEDRIIRELELTLTEMELKTEYKKLISEISEESAANSFGGSGFSRSQYELSWKKWEDKEYRLVLTNLTHNNSKLLLKTPEAFKKDIVELVECFLSKLKKDLTK